MTAQASSPEPYPPPRPLVPRKTKKCRWCNRTLALSAKGPKLEKPHCTSPGNTQCDWGAECFAEHSNAHDEEIKKNP